MPMRSTNNMGLMFMDGTGRYYSTNFGQILKYLDLNVVVAGQITPPVKVFIKNTSGFPTRNIQLWANNRELDGVTAWVEISKENAPFTAEESLLYNLVLNNQEYIGFYVRVVSTRHATTGGMFDILVNSEPLEVGI